LVSVKVAVSQGLSPTGFSSPEYTKEYPIVTESAANPDAKKAVKTADLNFRTG
jgi:hypothetical protein